MTSLKHLDLKSVPCPLNVVKIKLALEKLSKNEQLIVELDKGEPEEMVLNNLKEMGCLFKQIKENGFVSRGWLGVAVQEVTKDLADSFGLDVPRGALIGSVLKDSPAEKAGLKNGDVIIDFDGQQIIYSGDLPLIVGRIPPEKKVNATIFRDGKKQTVSVITGKLDEKVAQDTTVDKKEETGNILGIAVKDIASLTDQEQKQLGQDKGVVVSSVFPGPASEAGIRRGDIIDKIQFKDVSNIKDYEKISKTLKKGSTIALRIIRDKNGSFLTLKIPK